MTLDATVAGASADSYLTLAAADALAANDYGPEADKWTGESTTVAAREAVLKRATREIDDHVSSGFARYSSTQALTFPRVRDTDSAGDPIIPRSITNATYYQAAFLLSNAPVLARAEGRRARGQHQYSEPNTSGTQSDDMTSVLSSRALAVLDEFQLAASSRSSTSSRVASGFAA